MSSSQQLYISSAYVPCTILKDFLYWLAKHIELLSDRVYEIDSAFDLICLEYKISYNIS
jgi:hypothetical protein